MARPFTALGHRIVLILLALMFCGFAALQLNDPDPVVWTGIYLAAAAPCLITVWRTFHWMIPALLMAAAIVGAVVLWPSEFQGLTGKMDGRPGVELARESLGLMICALAMAYVSILQYLRRK